MSENQPFIAFRKKKPFGFLVYLVNPTKGFYPRVVTLTGGFASDDEGLVERGKMVKVAGTLLPERFLLLESEKEFGALDFVNWYHIDLYGLHDLRPTRFEFSLPKGGWKYEEAPIEILNIDTMRIELAPRKDEMTVEEEIKTMNMDAKYYSPEELNSKK